MNFEELREIGKIWILMGVFSTCFFASCGQSQTGPPETATPVTHTKPVSHEMEPANVIMDREIEIGEDYSEDLEGSGFSESDENDMNRFERDDSIEYTEDIPPPQQPAENPNSPTQEVSFNTPVDPNPEVALNATSPSLSDQAKSSEFPEKSDPAESTDDDDETTPFFAAQADDETDADDFSDQLTDDTDDHA